MRRILFLLGGMMILSFGGATWADVQLPAVFGDHMVVQQGRPVVIWGKADSGEKITVSLAGRTASTEAGADGRFRSVLPVLDAKTDPGPHELVVTGRNTLRFRDVLVGEVWLCGGQSNMRLTVKECANAAQEIAAANFDSIRLLQVPIASSNQPQFSFSGTWRAVSPRTVGGVSAAGYYFGRELYRVLNVPVGLIDSSCGWSPAEAWVPMEVLESDPATKPIADRQRRLSPDFQRLDQDYKTKVTAWKAAQVPGKEPSTPRPRRVWGVDSRVRAVELYNAMISPLAPFPLAGVIWYQGESNSARAEQYRTLLPLVIRHWRGVFENPDLPFGIVQLPEHVNKEMPFDGSWAELREAQLMTHRALPRTGLIVTTDIGEPFNIHPLNKQDVGARLARWALTDVYGKPGESTGPLYRSAAREGGRIRVCFDHVGKGLEAKGGPLTGFMISGEDRQFMPASAVIEKDSVLVSATNVIAPVAVRYGWSDRFKPPCNLFNADGLPASPFRTDDWPLRTAGVQVMEWQ